MHLYKDRWRRPNHHTILVDDVILANNKPELIETTKEELSRQFQMDDRGDLRWFLGLDFVRDGDTYTMSQERCADAVLRRFNMADCKPTKTPSEKGTQLHKATDEENQELKNYPYRRAIGSLIYLMMGTRRT